MKKFTLEDVKQYLKENDINNECELLSDSYIDSKSPLKFKCNKCQEIFFRAYSSVKRNSHYYCSRCSRGRNLSIEQVQDFLEKNDLKKDCTLLSTIYKNYYAPLLFKCNCCGEIFERKMSQVKELKRYFCYKCLKKMQGGYNKLSIEKVLEFIQQNDVNHDCQLLSQEYYDQETPLLFKCNCCGKEYERTYQTMRSKKAFKCFDCAHHLDPNRDVKLYQSLTSFFRNKIKSWKNNFLNTHEHKCDITGNSNIELDLHHIVNFSTLLAQASKDTGIPLIYYPHEFSNYGYDVDILVKRLLELQEEASAVLIEKKLHQKFHKIYGYKNNSLEQYLEFKNIILKERED